VTRRIGIAVSLLVAYGEVGCGWATRTQRDLAYALIREQAAVNDSSLTIPIYGSFGYPSSTTNPFAVRRLVLEGKFARLDSLFDAAADSAHRDYRNEYYLFDGYDAVGGDPTLAQPLDRWVEERPKSAPARIAKASYLTDLAWRTRGTAWAKDTPSQAIREMHRLLALATRNIDTALTLTPRTAAAYRVLLRGVRTEGGIDSSHRYVRLGLEDIPASFSLRRQHIRNLSPRWGGSYAAMRAFVNESETPDAATNPRLRTLVGFILLDSAEVLEGQGDQGDALNVYGRAIALGDEENFYLERGQLLVRMQRYRDALSDLDIAVATGPINETAYLWRGIAREGVWTQTTPRTQGARDGALADYRYAVVLNPTDDFALNRFVLLYARLQ